VAETAFKNKKNLEHVGGVGAVVIDTGVVTVFNRRKKDSQFVRI
jgi:hypothetical protein